MSIQPGVGYTFTSSSHGTNLNIEQAWQPFSLISEPQACSPFLVHDVVEHSGEGGSYVTYEICPGTLNNLSPGIYDTTSETWQYMDALPTGYQLILDFGGTSTCYVYLRAGPDPTTKVFPASTGTTDPDDPYPRIYSTGGAFPDDTTLKGHVKIAKVTSLGSGNYSVTQYVTGSLWGDRIQIGAGETEKAYYYYARI